MESGLELGQVADKNNKFGGARFRRSVGAKASNLPAGCRQLPQCPALRLCPQRCQLADRLASQAVEFAHRQHHLALQTVVQFAAPERSATEPAKLPKQSRRRQRLLLRLCQRQDRRDLDDVGNLITHDQCERLTDMAMNLHLDGTLELRLSAFKRRAQSPVQLRVAGLPNLVADMNARSIDMAAPELQLGLTR